MLLSNEQMVRNRFGRWARARRLVRTIQDALSADGSVVIATYTKATQYDRRHVAMFKATPTGAYVQRGKRWDCIDFAGISIVRPTGAAGVLPLPGATRRAVHDGTIEQTGMEAAR